MPQPRTWRFIRVRIAPSISKPPPHREGKVVFYSGMIENQALRPIADAFRRKYPFIAVEYWRGDSRALVQKALTERRAGRVNGDVLESTGGAAALIKAGASAPFRSPAMADYPSKYLDPNGFWAASRLDYSGLAYNTREVSTAEAPKTYDDLLASKWRGAIAWRADSEVGAPLFIAGILRSTGTGTRRSLAERSREPAHRELRRQRACPRRSCRCRRV